MKRPPGLWLLLITVFVWLCIEEVYSVKATSLIFGKTTTTTTAPSEAEVEEEGEAASGNNTAEESKLTGIPQLDYIYDPNLPRELNGYNLSEYPFYDRVPDVDEIDFKCDGLHDGFYASVAHKCQVYHHCLYGTRFDFLCANYTAFDQKTFICQFVSEVDCANSKKFWHRNDALYIAASTTTPKPVVVTQPPTPATPVPIVPLLGRRPMGGGRRRRPQRRRRPEYEYYDYEEDEEYYDEPPRRKRPRYRPRPIYDDEYDEVEEDSRDRRRPSAGRDEDRERPYKRRGSEDRRRNNGDRRRYEDEEYEDDVREEDRKRRPTNDRRVDERREKRPSNKRRPSAEEDEVDTRSYDRPRAGQRRPSTDDYEDEKVAKEEQGIHDRPRKNIDQDDRGPYGRPRNRNNNEGSRKFDRPLKSDVRDDANYEDRTETPLIKPISGGSVYNKPRTPPRIRPPVPKNEQSKYNYKTVVMKPSTKSPLGEEYYDDYDEELLPKTNKKLENETHSSVKTNIDDRGTSTKQTNREISSDVRERNAGNAKNSRDNSDDTKGNKQDIVDDLRDRRKSSTSRRGQPTRRQPDDDYVEDEIVTRRPNKRPKYEYVPAKDRRVSNFRKRPPQDEYESTDSNSQPVNTNDPTKSEEVKTITASKDSVRERPDPIVKVVKRPFLPSRGGSPYTPRGLQPVGTKALGANSTADIINEEVPETRKTIESTKSENTKTNSDINTQQVSRIKVIKTNVEQTTEGLVTNQSEDSAIVNEEETKPISPARTKYTTTNEDEFRSNRPLSRFNSNTRDEARVTETPKISNLNPLDIDESEYDVTLNDALNPTLPNLPVRGFPTGFSAPNDYTYNAYQRSRYVVDPTLNQASSDYVYAIKQPIPNYNSGGSQYDSNLRYSAPATYQNFRPSPRVTQAQAQPFYSSY